MNFSLRAPASAALFAALVVGCGGDSGSSNSVPAPPPSPSPTCTSATQTYSVVADAIVPVGRTAGAVVAGCSGPLRNVVWQQTGGPSVTLLSARTQAISFDAAATGVHLFSVTFTEASGATRTETVSINVIAPSAPVAVTARSDQAVRMGGKASVRAWPAAASGETLAWTQVAGPAVTMDTSDQNRIIFTAPAVTRDTALVFRVTRTGSASADSDEVTVLVEAYTQAPSGNANYIFSDVYVGSMQVSRVYPYKTGGPFAAVLVNCAFDAQLQYSTACPLATLPFLHTTTNGNVPTVAQIMDRVLVSHDWMGKNFEDLLTANQSNTDLLRLFNGVTAIVIGAHVRPSFYYAATGAIHLDADNFWLTADERDVIDEAPDFRLAFDRDLQYSGLWRYANNQNQNIFVPFSATSRISRDLGYLLQESGWLMYHELAHASDFLPVAVRPALNPALSAWGNIAPRYSANQLPSDQLTAGFPLTSAQMEALAEVKFVSGPVPDTTLVNGIPYSTLRLYSPNDVAGFFSADIATDEYNYTTEREDIAMNFEEVMMARNHSWRRDFAITDKLAANPSGSTTIVRWGQRGRVGAANIKPRAQFAVSQLAPWVIQADPGAVTNLPAPLAMRAGESWTANLVLPSPPAALARAQALAEPRLSNEQDQALLRRALARQVIGIAGAAEGHGTPNERWLKRQQR